MFYNLWFSPCGSFSIESRYIETTEADSAEIAILEYGISRYGGLGSPTPIVHSHGYPLCDSNGIMYYYSFTNFTHYPATNWIGARDGITKAVPVNECLSCPSFSCMKK